jgi:hypothetical protein
MRPPNAPQARLGLFDRLSVKLLGTFVATFLLTFLALWAYGISTSYVEASLAEAAMPQTPQPVVIDPNLRSELSAVMSMNATAEQPAIKDPFNDRSGLAGLSAAQRAVGGAVTTVVGRSGGPNSDGRATNIDGPPGRDRSGGSVGGGVSTPSEPVLTAVEATKRRYGAYLQRAALSDIPLDPRIFAIDDLLPVGLVDGGNGQQEVMFYSEAAARTFSFPIGTEFNDGWLSELRPEGVVFTSGDTYRSAKLRSWARALRSVG